MRGVGRRRGMGGRRKDRELGGVGHDVGREAVESIVCREQRV